MRVAQIRSMDISNGEGIGISIFTSGCPYHCEGCHNISTWAVNGGEEYAQETKEQILELVQKMHISRFSVLGGEPLLPQNVAPLLDLLESIKEVRPDIKIWLWTGTTIESLQHLLQHAPVEDEKLSALNWSSFNLIHLNKTLQMVDYLIDGRFIQEKKDLTLKWRGSSNQRVLDCKKSMAQQSAVLADI